MLKPIFCCDFDGVLHSYTSGWEGADVVSDPPVPGALGFLLEATLHFRVFVYSARSHQEGGIAAMQNALERWMWEVSPAAADDSDEAQAAETKRILHAFVHETLEWPTFKPAALVTLDDRVLRFTGSWPTMDELLNFKPWNKL